MTPKIKAKIKFCKFEGGIAMQVLYTHAAFVSTWVISAKEHVTSGMQVYSGSRPDLHHNCIALWGSEMEDHLISYHMTQEPIDSLVERYIEALKDWAKNWEGWEDEPAITPIIEEFPGGVVEVTV